VGWGPKVIPRPSADYFVVGRRQKSMTNSKKLIIAFLQKHSNAPKV
jgi:hypothetical protein